MIMNLNTQNFQMKKKMKKYDKHKFKDLFLEGHSFKKWFDIQNNEESDNEKLFNTAEKDVKLLMPPLEGDEEIIKEGKGIKILAPNKLLTRFPVLLAQIKAGNSS